MSRQFAKCPKCGKASVPSEMRSRIREADRDRLCRCGFMTIERVAAKPTPPPPAPAPAKIVMSKCEDCKKSIIPAHLRGQFKDAAVLERVCQCHVKPKVSAAPASTPPTPEPAKVADNSKQVIYIINQTEKVVAPPSKLVAILLALFLGPFGVHRFYIGDNLVGTFYLLVSLFIIPILSFCTLGAALSLYIPVYVGNLLEIFIWLLMPKKMWERGY